MLGLVKIGINYVRGGIKIICFSWQSVFLIRVAIAYYLK